MTNQPNQDMLVFNGLNGASGGYLSDPVTLTELRDRAYAIQEKEINLWESDEHLDDLKARGEFAAAAFELAKGYDPQNLASAGWGVIFPERADPAQVAQILEALDELIALRKAQAGGPYPDGRYRLFYGDGDGYRPGETGEHFADRHGVQPGSVDPEIMPYYLLIVGDPTSIPYTFQYQLDVQFATGRIYFETLDEYAQYAHSVVTSEASPPQVSLRREAVFFGAANEGDAATQLSRELLLGPLHTYATDETKPPTKNLGWKSQLVTAEQAIKTSLLEYMGGARTPALLFTASHGVGWPYGDNRQLPFQGGLVCQDWPGPAGWNGEISRDFFVAAEDIPSSASLLGSLAFFFACYGAGTPYLDDYAVARNLERKPIAHRPFIAALPRRLLSLPRGGALAVIGHVERAWGYSFQWSRKDSEPTSFKDFLYEAMSGSPVGYALESLNNRYGQIATQLSEELGEVKINRDRDPYNVSRLWMANNDARAYAILGDPAVRIPLAPVDAAASIRPATSAVSPRPGGVPVVLSLDLVPREELPFIQAEIAAQNLATTPIGDSTSQPATPDTHASIDAVAATGSQGGSAGDGAGADRRGVTGEDRQVERALTPAPGFTAPTRSPVDGLAMALQAYTSDEVDFGLGDDLRRLVGPVVENLFKALQETAQKLQNAASQAATLEITTSVVEDLDSFKPLNPAPGQARKRFVTTTSLTGDVQLFLPRQADDLDEVLLRLHKDMVDQAQANRLEMIKALAEMIASLFGSGK